MWYNPVSSLRPGLFSLLDLLVRKLHPDLQDQIFKLNIKFNIDENPERIKMPFADLSAKSIFLQDVHLAFLWCCSYATVAFNSMYYDKAGLDENVVTFSDRIELKQVNLTLAWARSLANKVTEWPETAARPDRPDKWSESATNLFQACAAYIVLHELGHLVLHADLVDLIKARRNPFYVISAEDIQSFHSAEKGADTFALESLLADSNQSEVLMVKYIGAALAQLSNFYLLDIPDTRGSITHPDLDDRLKSVIAGARLREEADRIQLKAHISSGLQLFLNLTGKPFFPENRDQQRFKDFEHLELFLFEMITEMKNQARGNAAKL